MNKESDIKINYEFILARFIHAHKSEKITAIQLSKNKSKLYFYLGHFQIARVYLAIRWRMKYFVKRKDNLKEEIILFVVLITLKKHLTFL